MIHEALTHCPHCGQPISGQEPKTPHRSNHPHEEAGRIPPREFDHRGIALPRRTRMGGIITPQ